MVCILVIFGNDLNNLTPTSLFILGKSCPQEDNCCTHIVCVFLYIFYWTSHYIHRHSGKILTIWDNVDCLLY